MHSNDDGIELRSRLGDFAADLLANHPAFAWRLLHRESATWESVRALCEGVIDVPREFFAAEDGAPADVLHAMWVPWPGTAANDRHRAVLFLHEQLLWSFTAYYNTAAVESPLALVRPDETARRDRAR
jgi:hypothetical protein